MRTLKMELAVVLMAFTSCAMERTSSEQSTFVARTKPEEVEIGSRRSILREASARDTILRIKLQSYLQCREEWIESFEKSEIFTVKPSSVKCSSSERNWQIGAVIVGGIMTPPGVYLIANGEGDGLWTERGAGVWLTVFGAVLLGQAGLLIHCAQEPQITETDLGRYDTTEAGKPYNCGWKPLQDVQVGVMLASGVVLRATTNDEGAAYFDLAGADSEDAAKMTLYVPQYEIIEMVVLDPTQQRLLAFALLPKQSAKLSPVYSAIKSKARHAAIACYESQFADNPIVGTITVSVEVAPSGRVRRLSGDFDPGSLSAVNACLWDKLANLQFESWRGEALAVRVPVNFEAPPPPVVLSRRELDIFSASPAGRYTSPPPPAPPSPNPTEPKKKVETVLVGGTPVVFVHDPSLGCTAGVAACQAAIVSQGGCDLIKRETRRAVGGLWGIVAGAAAGAVCDQQMQEICAKVVCGD